MHVSDAMEILCERRRFHAIVFLLLALNFMFIPIHIFVDLFLSYEPKHYCAIPPDGNKYAWIPYNYAIHEFYQCAIYDPPLSKELAIAEKHKILKDVNYHETKAWDWKSLKFKTKKLKTEHHHSDDDHHTNLSNQNSTKEAVAVVDDEQKRRRRREQPRPSPTESASAEDSSAQHRFVDEEGRLVESPTAGYDAEVGPKGSPVERKKGSDGKEDGDRFEEGGSVENTGSRAERDHGIDEAMEEAPEIDHEELSDIADEDQEEEEEENMQADEPHADVIVSHWHNLDWIGGGGGSKKRIPHPLDSANRARGYDDGRNKNRGSNLDHSESSSEKEGDENDESVDEDNAAFKISAAKDRSFRKMISSEYGEHPQEIHECQHGLHYETNVGTTLATEYGLSCKKDVSVITNTVLGTAMVAGAIIFAPFVDKYGRKTLFMMVCCQNVLISLGIAFVGDIRSYWVLRFLSRFYIEGVEIAILVLAVEMAPTKSRPIAPLILYVAYAIGQVLLSLQAMWFQSWWKLQLAISVETMLLIPFSWFLVPESIQWLVSMRRHADAEKLIRLGCRLNGTILASDFTLDRDGGDDEGHGHVHDDEATDNGHHSSQPRKSAVERLRSTQLNLKNRPGTGEYLQHEFHAHIGDWRKVIDLMKNHQLRRHFFIVSYMWAIVGFLYYGLTASTMVMKGNVYLNYCLSGLVMIPASVSIFILRKFGRKKPIFYFLIGAGIFIILSVICPPKLPNGLDLYAVYLATKLMAKYCVVSCLISIRLLIIELFPTPVRGTLIGLTAFIGLLGSALGYYFLELIAFSKWVGVVVGGLALLAAALSRLLPETSHRPLPDTINDMMAACREMFLNLLVAMPNVPRPPEEPATPVQARPKRNVSALSAFSAVLSWRSRSKSPSNPARSMSDEDFKRAPHMPLSSVTSAPLPRCHGDDRLSPTGGAEGMRALVARAREANMTQVSPAESPRQTLRQKLARALSTKRPAEGGAQRLDVPAEMARRPRRCSSTPSLSVADKHKLGIDNPQYEPDNGDGQNGGVPKVTFDLVRADSRGLASNGLEDPAADESSLPGSRGLREDNEDQESPDVSHEEPPVDSISKESSQSRPPSLHVNGTGSVPPKPPLPQTEDHTSINVADDVEPECTTQF